MQGDPAGLSHLLAPQTLRHLALAALATGAMLPLPRLHHITLSIQVAAARLACQSQYLAVVIRALVDTVGAVDHCAACLQDWAKCALDLLEQTFKPSDFSGSTRQMHNRTLSSASSEQKGSDSSRDKFTRMLMALWVTLQDKLSKSRPNSKEEADIFSDTAAVSSACTSLRSALDQLQVQQTSLSPKTDEIIVHRGFEGDVVDEALQCLDRLTAAVRSVHDAYVTLDSARAVTAAQQVCFLLQSICAITAHQQLCLPPTSLRDLLPVYLHHTCRQQGVPQHISPCKNRREEEY
jgi:hypothetical protein